MEQSLALAEAAQTGDIEALYALLRQNPYLLVNFDSIPFVDTSVHTAVSAGRTHFAIEILSLKPSFAKKLNPDGYSPIDLALTNGQTQTVKELIRCDPELIRVKSKERFTPLHYVTEMDDADLLAEFLVSCPKSIEDLTVRRETAVHIAVRNRRMRAFKVLLGWLSEANLVHILNWRDDKGDTVMHIAASTNNSEAVNLIMKNINITSNKNVEGLTAVDIARRLHNAEDSGSIAKMLRGTDTQRFSASSENLADRFILISGASRWRKVLMRLLSLLKESRGDNRASDETRQALLVVLVLIATATYQAMLTPPSVLKQGEDEGNYFKYSFPLFVFLFLNSVTFLVSIFMMCSLFNTDGLGSWMKISLICLWLCYEMVMLLYLPVQSYVIVVILLFALCSISILINKYKPIVRNMLTLIVGLISL